MLGHCTDVEIASATPLQQQRSTSLHSAHGINVAKQDGAKSLKSMLTVPSELWFCWLCDKQTCRQRRVYKLLWE